MTTACRSRTYYRTYYVEELPMWKTPNTTIIDDLNQLMLDLETSMTTNEDFTPLRLRMEEAAQLAEPSAKIVRCAEKQPHTAEIWLTVDESALYKPGLIGALRGMLASELPLSLKVRMRVRANSVGFHDAR